MSRPAVSVLITVYNAQRYLGEAIESVLGQSFRDFELVVVDDGSTDESPAILQHHAKRDDRLRVARQDNAGIGAAANHGLRLCRAELIARLDADDRMLPGRLQRQVALMNQSEAVCAGSAVQIIDAKGRFLTTLKPPAEDVQIQRQLLAGHCAIFHPGCIMRKAPVERIGGYDERFPGAHDLDLFLRLGEVGTLTNVPDPLTQYRLHAESISETRCEEQRAEARQACEEAWARRGIEGRFEAADIWRPGADRASRARFAAVYGWWAFNSGERRTAMIYGGKTLAAVPWSVEGWKLLAASALKPRPTTRREGAA